MRFIKLVFNAPLQSWGNDSRWDFHGTYEFPTKSGIVGLLGCCLGYRRNDDRLKHLSNSIHIAARADKPGSIIRDFQTAQAIDGQFINSEGKGRCDTLLLPRSYLQNACFTVFIWGDTAVLDDCYSALKAPKWTPYLGRKSCVPALPLIPAWFEAESVDDAVTIDNNNSGWAHVQIELLPGEVVRADEHITVMHDNVICSTVSEYTDRRVRCSYIQYGGRQ